MDILEIIRQHHHARRTATQCRYIRITLRQKHNLRQVIFTLLKMIVLSVYADGRYTLPRLIIHVFPVKYLTKISETVAESVFAKLYYSFVLRREENLIALPGLKFFYYSNNSAFRGGGMG